MTLKQKISSIIKLLDELYPDAQCSLKYQTPFQLLIATQLSAQCTDARVNTVTPILFAKFPTAQEMSKATPDSLEKILYPLGFFRSKAKNLVTCSVTLMERYKGEVPASMDALLTLAGVGRKTANLILGDVFNMPAIVTDTHAIRLSNRMGLTKNTDPKKVENDLRKIVPPKSSSRFCHQLVLHGRAVCTARKPKCSECKLFAANLCNFNLVG